MNADVHSCASLLFSLWVVLYSQSMMTCSTVYTLCKYFIILQIFKCDYVRLLAFQNIVLLCVTQTFFCSLCDLMGLWASTQSHNPPVRLWTHELAVINTLDPVEISPAEGVTGSHNLLHHFKSFLSSAISSDCKKCTCKIWNMFLKCLRVSCKWEENIIVWVCFSTSSKRCSSMHEALAITENVFIHI